MMDRGREREPGGRKGTEKGKKFERMKMKEK